MKAVVIVAVSSVICAFGCRAAPDAIKLENEAREIQVGNVTVSVKLLVGAVLEGHYVASTRYEIPGRGGASILFTTSSSDGVTLDEAAAFAAEQRTSNGPVFLVHKEGRDGRYLYTTQGVRGMSIDAHGRMPLPESARPPGSSVKIVGCSASLHRSSPLRDIEKKRETLEAVCRSMTALAHGTVADERRQN